MTSTMDTALPPASPPKYILQWEYRNILCDPESHRDILCQRWGNPTPTEEEFQDMIRKEREDSDEIYEAERLGNRQYDDLRTANMKCRKGFIAKLRKKAREYKLPLGLPEVNAGNVTVDNPGGHLKVSWMDANTSMYKADDGRLMYHFLFDYYPNPEQLFDYVHPSEDEYVHVRIYHVPKYRFELTCCVVLTGSNASSDIWKECDMPIDDEYYRNSIREQLGPVRLPVEYEEELRTRATQRVKKRFASTPKQMAEVERQRQIGRAQWRRAAQTMKLESFDHDLPGFLTPPGDAQRSKRNLRVVSC